MFTITVHINDIVHACSRQCSYDIVHVLFTSLFMHCSLLTALFIVFMNSAYSIDIREGVSIILLFLLTIPCKFGISRNHKKISRVDLVLKIIWPNILGMLILVFLNNFYNVKLLFMRFVSL